MDHPAHAHTHPLARATHPSRRPLWGPGSQKTVLAVSSQATYPGDRARDRPVTLHLRLWGTSQSVGVTATAWTLEPCPVKILRCPTSSSRKLTSSPVHTRVFQLLCQAFFSIPDFMACSLVTYTAGVSMHHGPTRQHTFLPATHQHSGESPAPDPFPPRVSSREESGTASVPRFTHRPLPSVPALTAPE